MNYKSPSPSRARITFKKKNNLAGNDSQEMTNKINLILKQSNKADWKSFLKKKRKKKKQKPKNIKIYTNQRRKKIKQ